MHYAHSALGVNLDVFFGAEQKNRLFDLIIEMDRTSRMIGDQS